MGRAVGIGLAVAALAMTAAGARSDEPGAAGGAARADRTCELPRVTERARVSSLRCVACHDGTTGPGTTFEMGHGRPGQRMSHPVEVDYAQARLRDANGYVPEAHLPGDVPLVEGKVACTSCHDGRSRLAKHVVDPVRLCYACHQK